MGGDLDDLRAGVDALREMLAACEAKCARLRAFNDELRRRLERATGRPVYDRTAVETSPPGCIPAEAVEAQLMMLRGEVD